MVGFKICAVLVGGFGLLEYGLDYDACLVVFVIALSWRFCILDVAGLRLFSGWIDCWSNVCLRVCWLSWVVGVCCSLAVYVAAVWLVCLLV